MGYIVRRGYCLKKQVTEGARREMTAKLTGEIKKITGGLPKRNLCEVMYCERIKHPSSDGKREDAKVLLKKFQ